MRFTRAELERFRDATVDDLVGEGARLVFVGINPGLWTAATGTHFAHPGNRFYPALLRAGIIERPIDRASGFTAEDRCYLVERGIGITNLVPRATAKASELTREELRSGGRILQEKVSKWRPQVVAFAGVTAFREAFDRRDARVGKQVERWGPAAVWVVPNPSGLNAHETVESLAVAYAAPAREAGIIP